VQVATSITDYIFRYLALRFLPSFDLDELGIRAPVKEVEAATVKTETGAEQKKESRFNSHAIPMTANVSDPGPVRVVYADSVCRACGGMLIQTGTCKTCIQCGTSNGGC
jgi:ribonucleoside-diphosphate reductase alpha chain